MILKSLFKFINNPISAYVMRGATNHEKCYCHEKGKPIMTSATVIRLNNHVIKSGTPFLFDKYYYHELKITHMTSAAVISFYFVKTSFSYIY